MNTNEDRLDVLKGKYLKLIETKQGEITAIRQKLSLLDELKAEADSLTLFPTANLTENGKSKENQFAASGLTESVIKMASWFGDMPFTPPEMRDYLLKNGFKPAGKNFSVSVGTTLKRLAERGIILSDKMNGKTVYKAKP